ncbi:MAG: hypothetical protein NTW07_10280 [candidate division Zixibacteria bacterium]|nr:hypothetical protein [candidate division Zixibacteria bacterium]
MWPRYSTVGVQAQAEPRALDSVAEAYVKLVLKVGLYDPIYVDSYYGPEEWRPTDSRPASMAYPLDQLAGETDTLIARMKRLTESTPNRMRHDFLLSQLIAVRGTLDKLSGKKMSFDEESNALFGTVAPSVDVNTDSLMKHLDGLLPGTGSIPERLDSLRARLVVPSLLVDTVFRTAMNEVRKRSLDFLGLPADESITLEYVTDQPWSAFNRYQGEGHSLISVNIDIPFYVYDAVWFASHEGYPGHHVQGIVGEERFVKDSGWVEFSVFALYSPQAIITEGMAEYSNVVLFTPAEKLDFEMKVLYPLAGFDTSLARVYSNVGKVLKMLKRAEIDICRDYLDGEIDSLATMRRLTQETLNDAALAENLIDFFEEFRSYNITYVVGEDLVRRFVEDSTSPGDMSARRARYAKILTTPYTPSELAKGI